MSMFSTSSAVNSTLSATDIASFTSTLSSALSSSSQPTTTDTYFSTYYIYETFFSTYYIDLSSSLAQPSTSEIIDNNDSPSISFIEIIEDLALWEIIAFFVVVFLLFICFLVGSYLYCKYIMYCSCCWKDKTAYKESKMKTKNKRNLSKHNRASSKSSKKNGGRSRDGSRGSYVESEMVAMSQIHGQGSFRGSERGGMGGGGTAGGGGHSKNASSFHSLNFNRNPESPRYVDESGHRQSQSGMSGISGYSGYGGGMMRPIESNSARPKGNEDITDNINYEDAAAAFAEENARINML